MSGQDCPGCGQPFDFCGPPINDLFCANEDCDWTRQQMIAGMRAAGEMLERQTYERLRAKFDPDGLAEVRAKDGSWLPAQADGNPKGGDGTAPGEA